MNPLVEYAHLFLNGEFDAYYKGDVYRINGYRPHNRGIELRNEYNIYPAIQNCTLIARPIEDMTNEEFFSVQEDMSVLDLLQKEKFIKILSDQTETEEGLSLSWIKRLGDWGMYFGPQSYFENGTVIDSREI